MLKCLITASGVIVNQTPALQHLRNVIDVIHITLGYEPSVLPLQKKNCDIKKNIEKRMIKKMGSEGRHAGRREES